MPNLNTAPMPPPKNTARTTIALSAGNTFGEFVKVYKNIFQTAYNLAYKGRPAHRGCLNVGKKSHWRGSNPRPAVYETAAP